MSSGHDIALALRAAYLAMHRGSDAAFAPHGLTADQFVLLCLLAQGDALTQSELARRAASDPNTVRAMLLLLERRGLVARQSHPTDRRARSVALTAKGRRVYASAWAAGEPVRARLLGALRRHEVPDLLDLLGRVTRALAPPDEAIRVSDEAS
jgi:DNA-binding MarR family transcriptional regulator